MRTAVESHDYRGYRCDKVYSYTAQDGPVFVWHVLDSMGVFLCDGKLGVTLLPEARCWFPSEAAAHQAVDAKILGEDVDERKE